MHMKISIIYCSTERVRRQRTRNSTNVNIRQHDNGKKVYLPTYVNTTMLYYINYDIFTQCEQRYTDKNHENIFLKICIFLQNSDFFSQNDNFFLTSADYRPMWEKNCHFEKKIRILEKNTHFEKIFSWFFSV